MADPDFLDQLQAGRDSLRKFQRSLVRMAVPQEQRDALMEGMSRMLIPGNQLQTLVDLMDAFGPPLAQIEALREELAEQRRTVDELNSRLVLMEASAERLATAAETIVAAQEPFVRLASLATGQKVTKNETPDDDTRTASSTDKKKKNKKKTDD